MKLLFGREQRYEIAYSVYLHQLFVATTTAHNHKMQKENENNSKRDEKKLWCEGREKLQLHRLQPQQTEHKKKILIKLLANNERRTEFHAKEKPIQRQTTQYDIFVSSITYRLVELIATRMLKISKR